MCNPQGEFFSLSLVTHYLGCCSRLLFCFQYTPRSQSHSRAQSRQSTPLNSDDVINEDGDVYMTSARVTTDDFPPTASSGSRLDSETFSSTNPVYSSHKPRINSDLFTDANGFTRATPSDLYTDKHGHVRAMPDRDEYTPSSYNLGGSVGASTAFRRHSRAYMGKAGNLRSISQGLWAPHPGSLLVSWFPPVQRDFRVHGSSRAL